MRAWPEAWRVLRVAGEAVSVALAEKSVDEVISASCSVARRDCWVWANGEIGIGLGGIGVVVVVVVMVVMERDEID